MTVLVTGAAGFIGYHLSRRLIEQGTVVIGLDNLNPYYDPALKRARIEQLEAASEQTGTRFNFIRANLEDKNAVETAFAEHEPLHVVNLAAQAGVRYSIINPSAYIQANVVGFGNLLECCRYHRVEHLIYASSSSVYGGNSWLPSSEHHNVDHPLSLYAATKKANELMAHAYSNLYMLPTTGLRFFTVYGPWGRPDMALFMFTKAMLEGRPIQLFNQGQMVRDFTYIDDIIESLIRLLDKPATPNAGFDQFQPDPATSWAPYRIFNIGNSNPTSLIHYVEALEKKLGITAKKQFLPMQLGDASGTAAETVALEDWIGFKPDTPVIVGVAKFVDWYREFYDV